MSQEALVIFLGLVFVAVFFLAQGLIVPVFGENRQTRKRLRERLDEIEAHSGPEESIGSIMRQQYLHDLAPWEQTLESLPMMESLALLIEQAGRKILAYRLVLLSVVVGLVVGGFFWELTRIVWFAALAAVFGAFFPIMKLQRERASRFAKFEAQLPDCIDIMRRAIMAGHPFSTSLKLVADDMEEPAAKEFGLTFADINYGNDVRHAMLGMLGRVPSVMVMALVTSILVQKETGGNLAEILRQISAVIRGRFRFQRRVRTLSAEGRLSAWVLAMVPLFLFVILTLTNPDYLPILTTDPTGQKILAGAAVWSFVGIYFIRKIIRIDV